jgi:VCBS repeat-containing protein
LAASVGLLGALAFTIPSSGATAPTEVRLHLGSDGRYFELGSTQQVLTTARNGCQITSAEPIIDLSSDGSQSQPGLGPDGIGVKQSPSSGNGSPCTQVESVETLRLKPGSDLAARRFSGVRLDLEMTGDALVQLTLSSTTSSVTYQLQTGNSITPAQSGEAGYDMTQPYFVSSGPGDETDACAAPNSSGPNNAGNDNCQWTVTPGFDFDTIALTTTQGTVSLEGSGDFANNPDFDTLLYLANSAPTAVADSYSTPEDTAVTGNVLANDSDLDSSTLTASLVSGPSDGTLQLGADGAFTYTPDADWSGIDSFTYAASDGSASSNATVTITVTPVNDAPVATSGNATTPEDTSVTVTVATDIDSTDLTADCESPDGGTITDNGDGTIDFLPPADFNGSITITCTVTDDDGATTEAGATVEVGVDAVNDAPVAADDAADVDEDDSVIINVLGNDSDVDGDELDVADIADVLPAGATAQANLDGTVTYTPPADFTGVGSFTYRADDSVLTSDPATVEITVFPVMCSLDTVSDTDGDVTGSFTRLSDPFECKRYSVTADDADDTVFFAPSGDATVSYRGVVSFGAEPAPGGSLTLLLRYDPAGGEDYQPVLLCIAPQFDSDGLVTSATLPAGETWCLAEALTRADEDGNARTTWQVYGEDDPRFTR